MDKKSQQKQGHLFNIDILIEGRTNGIALEKLLQLMNHNHVVDYKINNGIGLGKIIEATIENNQKKLSAPKVSKILDVPKIPIEKKTSTPKAQKPENDNQQIIDLIQYFKKNGTLVRLSVIKGKGVRLSMPCRIINYDTEMGAISVYHVDEKKVYMINLNEIDDFIVN